MRCMNSNCLAFANLKVKLKNRMSLCEAVFISSIYGAQTRLIHLTGKNRIQKERKDKKESQQYIASKETSRKLSQI